MISFKNLPMMNGDVILVPMLM